MSDLAARRVVPVSAVDRRHLARQLVDPSAASEPAVVPSPGSMPPIIAVAGDAGLRLWLSTAPAKVAIRRFIAGTSRFETALRSSENAPEVRFRVTLRGLDSARAVDQRETVMLGGQSGSWGFDLKFLFGDAIIELEVEPAQPGGSHEFWAEFVDPSLG